MIITSMEEGWRWFPPPQVAESKKGSVDTNLFGLILAKWWAVCCSHLMKSVGFPWGIRTQVRWVHQMWHCKQVHRTPEGKFAKRPLPVFSKQCQAASLEARSRFRHATRKRKWPRGTRGGRGNMAGWGLIKCCFNIHWIWELVHWIWELVPREHRN